MFQQMQAMAQKQVIIVNICPVLHASLVVSYISKVLSNPNVFFTQNFAKTKTSPALLASVCSARHFASLCQLVSVTITWAFYFVIPLSSSLFLLELLLIVSFHSWTWAECVCREALCVQRPSVAFTALDNSCFLTPTDFQPLWHSSLFPKHKFTFSYYPPVTRQQIIKISKSKKRKLQSGRTHSKNKI